MNTTLIKGRSLLAGRHGSTGGRVFHAFNPATASDLPEEFHEAQPFEVEAAAAAARDAFPVYRAKSGAFRAGLLEKIAAGIEALGDPLLERAHAETGLSIPRLQSERARTCAQLRLFAEVVREGSWVDARIDLAQPERKPLPRPDLRRLLVPLGPVVVFGSSNFPLAFSVAGGDTTSALAAGCPVIVKAHRAHPGTAEMVGQAVAAAVAACGLPGGVFSLIHGSGADAGVALVKHPAIAAVGFTGSHAAGMALCAAAASRPHPIPVFAEMSSLNPVFVLPGAVLERGPRLAQDLFGSFTLGVGQFCTKPGLLFVLEGAGTDTFLSRLSSLVLAAPAATMLTAGIRDAFEYHRTAVTSAAGVQLLAHGTSAACRDRTEATPSVAVTDARRFGLEPSLMIEAFGPFLLVVRCGDLAELLACAQSLEGQLTATVHGNASDLAAAQSLWPILGAKAGRLIANGFPTGVEVCPAMHHGGPSPATSDSRFTAVGTAAILRFARPLCFQDFPHELLPAELRNENPLAIMRIVGGVRTREALA